VNCKCGGREASDRGEDLVCRFCPAEWFGLLIVDRDELPDCGFQFLNAPMRSALDLSLGERCKPTLYLVEPRGMGGGEVKVIARPLLQPMADQRCLVSSVVIQHQMYVEIRWNSIVYLLKKVEELHRTVAAVALAEYIAGRDIESSEQIRDAVSLVIVCASLLLPCPHGQDWLSPAEGLNLRFLVHA
jgi:hypothetical protein